MVSRNHRNILQNISIPEHKEKKKEKREKKICLITGKFRLHGHMQAIWILRTEEQIKEEKAFFILKRLKILSKMSSNLVFFFPFITTTVFVEKKPWLNMHVSMVKTTSRSKRSDSKAATFWKAAGHCNTYITVCLLNLHSTLPLLSALKSIQINLTDKKLR